MLLYGMLHLTGYDLSLDDLREFRQWDSRTPGHPEHGVVPGVETTTGPLGQGLSNAVGMAIAEAHLAAEFNDAGQQVVDHRTYVIAGDGDLMEGVSSEAASLAGHLALGKLIVLYDDNHISIDGATDLAFTEDRVKRFEAYGWHVQRVDDGEDREAIHAALVAAEAETARPSLIALRTHIAYGSPNKQDTSGAHGAPLGADEIRLTKENLGWPVEPDFLVPDEVSAYYREAAARAAAAHEAWRGREAVWRAADPGRAARWDAAWARALPEGWEASLPVYPADAKGVPTRAASGDALAALVPAVPALIGGSADLTPSNNTRVAGMVDFQSGSPEGRYLRFGVREHAMAAVANGLALHGGLRPYIATFFVFTDYLRPALRLAALMGLPVTYVMTHDSIGVGEDGPTHQPVEHLAALRAIPGAIDLRPADANETMEAWKIALRTDDAPVALMLTRQRVPTIDRERCAPAAGVARGAYVLADCDGAPDIILIASGSEVQLALAAHVRLLADGVRSRVVNLASWALFERQDAAYREAVLPAACRRRLAVEAAASFGWERWTGLDGATVTLDRFGASAPGDVLFQEFGFTSDNVYARAKALLDKGVD
jgi:transketolase